MLISVIIPLYNSESYIKKCVDSLVKSVANQNDIEFIFIDDESTDNSLNILKSYSDSRIKIIQKKHSNVYDAWKLGLKHSSGEYIMGVDSDDFVNHALFCDILNKLKSEPCDLIMFNYKKYSANGMNEKISKSMMPFRDGIYLKGSEDFNKLITPDFEYPCCLYSRWNKVFKKSKLLQVLNNAKLYDELCTKIHEDMKIIALMFNIVDSIFFIDKPYYFYRIRNDSITHEKDKIKIDFEETNNLMHLLEINKDTFNLSIEYLDDIRLYRYALLYLKSTKFKNYEMADSIYESSVYRSLLDRHCFKNKLLGFMMKRNMKRCLHLILLILK